MGGVRVHEGVDASMQVRNVARRLERYSSSYRFSLNELEALHADISEAESRLLNGLYREEVSVAPRVSDRTEELFGDVGFYWSAGQVWRELLAALGVGRRGRVVEVGCGVVPKVGGALHYHEFEGSLDLVDISERSLQYAARWLTLLGCRFPHHPICSGLLALEARSYDGVFANHTIDDLLLFEYCTRTGRSLEDLYIDGALYTSAWREIANLPGWISEFVDELVEAIASALVPGGVVALCDYESHSHRELGLLGIMRVVRDVQDLVRRGLLTRGLCSLDARVPLHLTSDRFEVRRADVIAFKKLEVAR